MNVYPTKLQRAEHNQLVIEWSDGERRNYSAGELRDACPCATCREKASAPAQPATMLPVIGMNEARPLAVEGMTPVGNYAYAIRFSDGHDTGIFSFELLRALGKCG